MRRRRRSQGLAMGLLAAAAAVLGAAQSRTAAPSIGPADWPQWRGPNRDGAATSFTVPATWPERLTRRWKTDVGSGYANPLIIRNRLY